MSLLFDVNKQILYCLIVQYISYRVTHCVFNNFKLMHRRPNLIHTEPIQIYDIMYDILYKYISYTVRYVIQIELLILKKNAALHNLLLAK